MRSHTYYAFDLVMTKLEVLVSETFHIFADLFIYLFIYCSDVYFIFLINEFQTSVCYTFHRDVIFI